MVHSKQDMKVTPTLVLNKTTMPNWKQEMRNKGVCVVLM